MQINPILIKEMKVRARIVRIPIFVMIYNAVLAFIGIFMWISSVDMFGINGNINYRSMNELFAGIGMVQCAVVSLVTLLVAAGSISGEREMGTWDILLMTPVRTWEVINGKLFSAILTGFLFTFSSLPVLALGTVYGGTDILDIIYLQVIVLLLAFSAGSIGIFCSALSKKTSISVALSLSFEAIMLIVPFIVLDFVGSFLFNSYQYESIRLSSMIFPALIQVFNPVMLMFGFYDRIMGSNYIMDTFHYSYGIEEGSSLYVFLEQYFMEVCVIGQLAVVGLLLVIVARVLKKGRNLS